MQNYIYHLKPKDLKGTVLQPLNQILVSYPDLYTRKVKKYAGREFLLERNIPTLDCLWNDVLHLSPIEPTQWKKALVRAGMEDKPFTFYKIDSTLLDQNNLAIYLFKELERFRKQVPTNEFIPFTPEKLRSVRGIPAVAQIYFKDCYSSGEKPLLFFGIPHILYKGTIDISQAGTITV